MLTDTDAGERPSPHRRDLTVGTLTGKGSLMPPHPATVLRADTTDIAEPGRVWVSLFGVPYVSVDGERLDVPEGSKRLLAFVCLGGRRIERRRAAGVLWPDGDDVRAAGNLRSALWRLKGCGIDVVDSDKVLLWLREDAVVDVEVMQGWATRLIAGQPEPPTSTSGAGTPTSWSCSPGGTTTGRCSSGSGCASCCCMRWRRWPGN